ncbi:MAG: glycosyltransferase family 2 protein [Verrucomicrobiae bacterium]|nr:glycosyltransferase family 2 protein [Verrucomicrobiae bacterium]
MEPPPPEISVIFASLGREAVVRDAVADLLRQEGVSPEVVVVLQRADTANLATAELRAWHRAGRIRLFEENFANAQRARNLGILAARAPIVLLLDDDVRVPPDLVACHLANYRKDPSLDGVAGQALEPGQAPTRDLPAQHAWPHLGWQFFPLNYAERAPAVNWPSTNSSVKRALAIRVGGFDTRFERTWLDDTDFSCRLRTAGARLVFDPTATVTHLKVRSGGRRLEGRPDLWMDAEGWATHFYFWRKNFGVFRARRAIAWNLRYLVFRKAVVLHPVRLARNLAHIARGWRLATAKLRAGPLLLDSKDAPP